MYIEQLKGPLYRSPPTTAEPPAPPLAPPLAPPVPADALGCPAPVLPLVAAPATPGLLGTPPPLLPAELALPAALVLPDALEVVPAPAGVSPTGASDEHAPVAANASAITQPSESERIMAVVVSWPWVIRGGAPKTPYSSCNASEARAVVWKLPCFPWVAWAARAGSRPARERKIPTRRALPLAARQAGLPVPRAAAARPRPA